jgi:hypothetical protein
MNTHIVSHYVVINIGSVCVDLLNNIFRCDKKYNRENQTWHAILATTGVLVPVEITPIPHRKDQGSYVVVPCLSNGELQYKFPNVRV